MNLADKPCYPSDEGQTPIEHLGLTFRERLIIALAENSMLFINPTKGENDHYQYLYEFNAKVLIRQADAIIKEMEAEK